MTTEAKESGSALAAMNQIPTAFGRVSGSAPGAGFISFPVHRSRPSLRVPREWHRRKARRSELRNVKAGNIEQNLCTQRIIAFHQHVPAPITDTDHERMVLEIGRRLPWAEDLQNPLLCIFVLDGRALRVFAPCGHVLHAINLLFHPGPGCGPRGGQGGAHSHRAILPILRRTLEVSWRPFSSNVRIHDPTGT